ncbi:unnamed protein product [Phytophthora lilii]|uniref:Unnamed protein product n=1 Tax=Phytophthora lilii TaxID=2077276 RepID=A0A9W6TQL4_9STRA|nr:unnamed protein product [Phytophthora lilii]
MEKGLQTYFKGLKRERATAAALTSDRLQATGVPPHVAILREIKSLLDVAVKTVEHVDAARTETVKDIMWELEQRAIGAGVVTFDGLDTALKRCLDSAGVTTLVQQLNAGSEKAPSEQHSSNSGSIHRQGAQQSADTRDGT